VSKAGALDYVATPEERMQHALERPLDRYLMPLATSLALRTSLTQVGAPGVCVCVCVFVCVYVCVIALWCVCCAPSSYKEMHLVGACAFMCVLHTSFAHISVLLVITYVTCFCTHLFTW
jgi:hypothetical protein